MPQLARCLVLMALVALAGCASPRDPATEEPVDPVPGLYRITLSGAGLARFARPGPEDPKDDVCVTAFDSPRFADRLTDNYFSIHPGCVTRRDARAGNRLGGTITCPLDPGMAAGTSTVSYEGTISTDRVEATSRMRIDARPIPGALSPEEQRQIALGAALVERVGIQVTAVRTGDCV